MKTQYDVELLEAKRVDHATPVSKNKDPPRNTKTAREAFCMTGDSQNEIF